MLGKVEAPADGLEVLGAICVNAVTLAAIGGSLTGEPWRRRVYHSGELRIDLGGVCVVTSRALDKQSHQTYHNIGNTARAMTSYAAVGCTSWRWHTLGDVQCEPLRTRQELCGVGATGSEFAITPFAGDGTAVICRSSAKRLTGRDLGSGSGAARRSRRQPTCSRATPQWAAFDN